MIRSANLGLKSEEEEEEEVLREEEEVMEEEGGTCVTRLTEQSLSRRG